MDILEQIAVQVEAGDKDMVESLVKECIDQKMAADDILSKGLVG
ncbi:MAG: B12-binding domain-containing protein [Deltaproteobacteria bacterium]|nr:B12-binding domain-containing protein [Deltaproteobacteria bacterium]MBW1846436.1 B12-binding domain-containing protein [Deltaproteobacteria bacterium]MBW2179925.1 B12-binding domain-containing protein [Deltaproteobacteria bacterium]MBW2365028.1 B12-binding domain-containing protein [Deltaproteobacteria bacterium]